MDTNEHRSPVERVLDGDLAYDDLDFEEYQALVRQAWDQRIPARIAGLDFEGEFTARGRAWTEVDERGNAARHEPPGVGPSR